MSIVQRTTRIIAANVNDWVDAWEQPDKMLRQAARDLEASIGVVKAATARSIANERLMTQERLGYDAEQAVWVERARAAVSRQDDGLARRAIAQQLAIVGRIVDVDRRLAESERTTSALRSQLTALRKARTEVHDRLLHWSTSQALLHARREATGMIVRLGQAEGVLTRIEPLTRNLESHDAAANAWLELDAAMDDAANDAFRRSEDEAAIDAELARLKTSLG